MRIRSPSRHAKPTVASLTAPANATFAYSIDEYFGRTDSVGVRNYLTDALGSSVALADGSGATQTEYTYEPFGATTTSGASTNSSFAFTGREIDPTGLYYYRARYYSPALVRFVSEDPIGFAGGFNVHRYVSNDPVMHRDPMGLQNFLVGVGGSLIAPTGVEGSAGFVVNRLGRFCSLVRLIGATDASMRRDSASARTSRSGRNSSIVRRIP